MRVAAVADIHSPKYLDIFKDALAKFGGCDLFLIAGDLVLKNDWEQLPAVVDAIREVYDGRVLACFGNEEYEQDQEKYEEFGGLEWVEGAATIEIRGLKVGVIGSRGSLDRPTFWQRTHVKGIRQIYRQRVEAVDRALAELRADIKVVMTHYAPTYATLEGERESAWPEMACKLFEDVIKRRQPDVWFHGHAHRGTKFETTVGKTLVSNISLPARQEIVTIDLPRKVGIEKFFKP
ncbi:MAG: metallophosphoesterase [Hadesarchaea archaeon]|nr:metallophosphoesterase [Hadesarchaea archaeon]